MEDLEKDFTFENKKSYLECTSGSCCYVQRNKTDIYNKINCKQQNFWGQDNFDIMEEHNNFTIKEHLPEYSEGLTLDHQLSNDGKDYMFLFNQSDVSFPLNDSEYLFFKNHFNHVIEGSDDSKLSLHDKNNYFFCLNKDCCINNYTLNTNSTEQQELHIVDCIEELKENNTTVTKEICDFVPKRFCLDKKIVDYCADRSQKFRENCCPKKESLELDETKVIDSLCFTGLPKEETTLFSVTQDPAASNPLYLENNECRAYLEPEVNLRIANQKNFLYTDYNFISYCLFFIIATGCISFIDIKKPKLLKSSIVYVIFFIMLCIGTLGDSFNIF